MLWWILQDPDDTEPWGVVVLDEQGLVRRYVSGVGLVRWPSMGDYVWLGETGGHRVDQDEALKLINSGWTGVVPTAEEIASAAQDTPVLPVPETAVS